MDSPDTPPSPDSNPGSDPARAPTPAPAPAESLHKQLRELQARFDAHQQQAAAETTALWEQHLYLKQIFTGALVVLLLFNAGIFPFFAKQMKMVRNQLPNQRVANYQITANLAKHDPALRKFAAQLQTFGAAHPDFRPILDAYRPHLPQYFTSINPALPNESPSPAPTN